MLKASPSQNLINFQLEFNWNLKENAQGQPKPGLLRVSSKQNLIDFQISKDNSSHIFIDF